LLKPFLDLLDKPLAVTERVLDISCRDLRPTRKELNMASEIAISGNTTTASGPSRSNIFNV
jgi:hypothetical protein